MRSLRTGRNAFCQLGTASKLRLTFESYKLSNNVLALPAMKLVDWLSLLRALGNSDRETRARDMTMFSLVADKFSNL